MTGMIHAQLARLADTIATLKERVRAAVAGELGRAVSGAIEQLVQAAFAGRPVVRRADGAGWADEYDGWDRPHDPWATAPEDVDDEPAGPSPPGPGVAAAVAAGVYATRWWAARQGTRLAAAGLGLVVGLLGVLGGPAARTAIAVLAATADLLAATDALGAGAARLGHH